MKLKSLTLIIATGIILFSSACSSTKYIVDVDNTIDFTQYKTYEYYGWAEESNKILNTLDQGRIERAFGTELAKRGLEHVEDGGDLIITLYIVTEAKTQTTATTTHMGMGMGGYGGYYGYGPAYGWGGGSSHTTYNEYDYTVGTLIIDIYDAKNKRLVWESIAKGTVNEKTKGRDERIQQLAARMMREFPVPLPTDKKK